MGLPYNLVKNVIKSSNPQMFKQWVKDAQQQQCNWLHLQSFKKDKPVMNFTQPG